MSRRTSVEAALLVARQTAAAAAIPRRNSSSEANRDSVERRLAVWLVWRCCL